MVLDVSLNKKQLELLANFCSDMAKGTLFGSLIGTTPTTLFFTVFLKFMLSCVFLYFALLFSQEVNYDNRRHSRRR